MNKAETKTYIVAQSDYMGEGPDMSQFVGTYRQLLEDLNGVDDDNKDEEFNGRKIKDLSDEELKDTFNQANGDGQPYCMVWCVEDQEKILG
jgi:hypothetical protein